MPLTKFDICTQALTQIGADPITDFNGGSQESETCSYLYQPTVDNWLSMYPWRFATKQTVLSRNVTAPTTIWTGSYAQPGDMITLQAVSIASVNIPFDRYENKIFCNASATDTVHGIYIYSISESFWPAYFVQLIELALMEKLAFALPSKLDLKEAMAKRVDAQYRMAKAADARQQTSRVLPTSGRRSIMEARRA
jgi:hypothetical protein